MYNKIKRSKLKNKSNRSVYIITALILGLGLIV